MSSLEEKLSRAYKNHIRDLEDDVEFLRYCLSNMVGGEVEITIRKEEVTGTNGTEDLIKEMLGL